MVIEQKNDFVNRQRLRERAVIFSKYFGSNVRYLGGYLRSLLSVSSAIKCIELDDTNSVALASFFSYLAEVFHKLFGRNAAQTLSTKLYKSRNTRRPANLFLHVKKSGSLSLSLSLSLFPSTHSIFLSFSLSY